MVKLVFLCRRRPDITHARYTTLLLEGHVPLALAHHPTMRRYVVNIVDEVASGAPPLDSIGELWFESLTDFRERLYDSPEGERLIARDVAGFLGGADAYATRERVVRASPGGASEQWFVCVRDSIPPRHENDLLAGAGVVESNVEECLSPGAPAYHTFVEVTLGHAASEKAAREIAAPWLTNAAAVDIYRVTPHAHR